VSLRWLLFVVLAALAWPAAASAHHIQTSATVDARVVERRGPDYWTIDISWGAGCTGAAPGTAWFDGDLFLVDLDTGERIYVGGVVSTSGERVVSGTSEWAVNAIERSQRLMPELMIHCYENFPLHGGPEIVVTGATAVVPARLAGGGDGSGGGSGGSGGGGGGDPSAPLSAGGCLAAILGTEAADQLTGGDAGEVVLGFGGGDRIAGGGGHDCLIGGGGRDVLRGEAGSDRLSGGAGNDTLVGGPGRNAYDAGAGRDVVDARNGTREVVRCGAGRDRARVDRRDRVRGCERVSRPG
jgi:Ca2+-binding RTX toxin-like protein